VHIDNGQHILLGAYKTILNLLSLLGIPEKRVFRRLRLDLYLRDLQGRIGIRLKAPPLPAPVHITLALATAEGLTWSERLLAVRLALSIHRQKFGINPDVRLIEYLQQHKQTPALIRALWQPLCLAALNTPVEQASTALFLNVLRDAFTPARPASDLLLPITDLGNCLPEPARDYIEQHGGSVRLAARALGIRVIDSTVNSVLLERSSLLADHVIIATAPKACVELVQNQPVFGDIVAKLNRLDTMPICTLYLQYPEPTTLGRDFIGLLGASAQWLFDRGRLTGERGLMAAVISGPGGHMKLATQHFISQVVGEIAGCFPHWPQPLSTKLIREKQATFAAYPGVDQLRPAHTTPVKGLWLAGDYTATGYPGTLESAALSGVACARLIINNRG
jgi:squalene-associated FAD-dependent desaturase